MVKLFRLLILSSFILVVFYFTASVASAQEETTSEKSLKPFKMQNLNKEKNSSTSAKDRSLSMAREGKSATPGARKIQKLSDARVKLCKARAKNISNRVESLLLMGTARHKYLNSIVKKVDKFYLTKLEPEGNTLSNYDALKSDISDKQNNVSQALATAKEDGQNFSCDSEDPKTQADTFRKDVLNLIAANKEYKKSVKNFTTAVRDIAKSTNPVSLSPQPTSMPEEEEVSL